MSRPRREFVSTDADASEFGDASGLAHASRPARAGRAGWVLAAVVLAGAVASWCLTLTAPAVELRPGALLPRQQELEAAAQEIARLEADTPVVVLSPDPEDTAFARYLLYPRRVIEAPVRPRERFEAALAAVPADALVLAADPLARDELARLRNAGLVQLERLWGREGDVMLLRLRR
jgi:hypothetical protein